MKRVGLNRTKKAVKHPVAPRKDRARVPPAPRPAARRVRLDRLRARRAEPGYAAWKTPHRGTCVGCGRRGWCFRHHVVREQDVRRAGGDPWDLRNALSVGVFCSCHADHHASSIHPKRIPLDRVPDEAVAFAIELFGRPKAALYFARWYDAS